MQEADAPATAATTTARVLQPNSADSIVPASVAVTAGIDVASNPAPVHMPTTAPRATVAAAPTAAPATDADKIMATFSTYFGMYYGKEFELVGSAVGKPCATYIVTPTGQANKYEVKFSDTVVTLVNIDNFVISFTTFETNPKFKVPILLIVAAKLRNSTKSYVIGDDQVKKALNLNGSEKLSLLSIAEKCADYIAKNRDEFCF